MAACRFLLLLFLFASSTASSGLEIKQFCIYDPVGNNGPSMTFFADFIPKAISWGLDVKLNVYTDEKVASNDFKAGICEAVFLTAILGRQYVSFGGTLDAAGGIISMNGLNRVVKTMASPQAAKLLRSGRYEVVGTFPVGAVYLFVKDRNIDSVADFSGKRILVLNEDPQVYKFASLAGATPIGTSLATFAEQFNSGNVDILPMVALGYNIFELYRGLGDTGGIIDHKLYYGMMQLIASHERFTADFGQKMREYILGRMSDISKLVEDAEAAIPSKYWIETNAETQHDLDLFTRDIRLALKKDGVIHPKALKLLWKVRCSEDPTRAECDKPE